MGDGIDDTHPGAAPPRRLGRQVGRRLAVVALAMVVVWLVIGFVGDVDWSAVRTSLGRLSLQELGVLAALMLVRNALNALPLALFINGIGMVRALVNDLTAHLLAVVAPPPSDVLLRLRMFASWDIAGPAALAGAVANMIVFYTVRFAMPLVGTALLATRGETGPLGRVMLSSLVAGTILIVALAAVRHESTAARVGLSAGHFLQRVRRSIDPEQWSRTAMTFREHVAAGFRSHLAVSMLGLVVMVLVDATIVVLALRFVGVSAASVPAFDVYVAFCLFYPFTLFPFMGLGIVDGLLVAELVGTGGSAVEAAIIAGLAVWRTVTLGGPILLGGVTLLMWRLGLVPARQAPAGLPNEPHDGVAPP